MKVKGYKVAAELEGTTLTATADGKIGRAALGTDERAIDLTHVEAVSFEPAGMMKNGSLVLVDARGKTQLHFRRKDNDDWNALYNAVAGLVPSHALNASTKGAALASEDRDAPGGGDMAKLDKLLNQAKEHLDEGEEVLAVVKGTYETKKMGNDWTRAGILVATDHRVVFFAKKIGGYDFEVFPYKHISSIETGKGMMGHHITFFASGNQVHLKWIDKNSDAPGFVTAVKDQMTVEHATPAAAATGDSPDIADQIRKLGQLRDEGLVSEEEFETKSAELLARL